MRRLAEVIGAGLNVPTASIEPEDVPAHFGFLAMFAGRDAPASSKLTREALGWETTGPGLIEDLETGTFFDGPEAVMMRRGSRRNGAARSYLPA